MSEQDRARVPGSCSATRVGTAPKGASLAAAASLRRQARRDGLRRRPRTAGQGRRSNRSSSSKGRLRRALCARRKVAYCADAVGDEKQVQAPSAPLDERFGLGRATLGRAVTPPQLDNRLVPASLALARRSAPLASSPRTKSSPCAHYRRPVEASVLTSSRTVDRV